MMRLGAETLGLLKDVGWLGRSHGTVVRAFGGEQSKLTTADCWVLAALLDLVLQAWLVYCRPRYI
jgi:hypothetical protein